MSYKCSQCGYAMDEFKSVCPGCGVYLYAETPRIEPEKYTRFSSIDYFFIRHGEKIKKIFWITVIILSTSSAVWALIDYFKTSDRQALNAAATCSIPPVVAMVIIGSRIWKQRKSQLVPAQDSSERKNKSSKVKFGLIAGAVGLVASAFLSSSLIIPILAGAAAGYYTTKAEPDQKGKGVRSAAISGVIAGSLVLVGEIISAVLNQYSIGSFDGLLSIALGALGGAIAANIANL
jgi:hypothetical protein